MNTSKVKQKHDNGSNKIKIHVTNSKVKMKFFNDTNEKGNKYIIVGREISLKFKAKTH